MNNDPYGPLIDAREREIEVARRRMWLPVTILAALLLWAICYGLFVLLSDMVYSASSVWAP